MIVAPACLIPLTGVTDAYIIIYHLLHSFNIECNHDAVISPVTPGMIKVVVVPGYHAKLECWRHPIFTFISSNLDTIEIL